MIDIDVKKTAIESFNQVWALIDKPDKTDEDKLNMIRLAHRSLHCWIQFGGTILHIVRGEWMISHVYSVLGMGEAALYHAQTCYEATLDHEIGDFDLVFAYEAMAFAYNVLGEIELKNQYLDEGYSALDQIVKDSDREYALSQLDLQK